MKHLLFLVAATFIGGLGAVYHPFWGILLYYSLAVLRPQYLWKWALPVELRWSLFAAIIVLVSLMINMGRGFFRIKFTMIPIYILIYSFFLLLSAINATNPAVAQYWGQEYAKIIFVALIAIMVLDRLWQIKGIVLMLIFCLGYISWDINYLYFAEGRLDIFHHGYGGLDNNGAGLMLAMGIPLCYAFAVSAKRIVVRIGAGFLGMLILHAVLMTFSRGAMLAALVGLIWVVIHHRPRYQAALITMFMAAVISVLAGQEIQNRFMTTANFNADTSAQSRFDSWQAGWAIAMDHPFTGQGIRNSNLYTYNYGADKIGRTIHSQYIQIAADTGIFAMMIYLLLLFTAFIYIRRSRHQCMMYLENFKEEHPDEEPDNLIKQFIPITLGIESSLVLFCFGAAFLSVEVFELPWIMLVLCSATPIALDHHIKALTGEIDIELLDPLVPQPEPAKRKTSETSIPLPSINRGFSRP